MWKLSRKYQIVQKQHKLQNLFFSLFQDNNVKNWKTKLAGHCSAQKLQTQTKLVYTEIHRQTF